MDGRLAEDGRNLAKGKTIKGTKYTLNCLSIGTPKIIHFLFVSNGKLIFFVVPVFKHFTTVKQFIFVKKKLGAHIRHIRMPTKNFFQSILACTTTPPPPTPQKTPKKTPPLNLCIQCDNFLHMGAHTCIKSWTNLHTFTHVNTSTHSSFNTFWKNCLYTKLLLILAPMNKYR